MAPKIILDYKSQPQLFDEVAREWAAAVGRTKKSQIRNFYDKVLELEKEAQIKEFSEVLPFVKMLNSKVAYGISRKVVSSEFQEMIKSCIDQVDSPEKLKVFKLFFEAVLGFYEGGNKDENN